MLKKSVTFLTIILSILYIAFIFVSKRFVIRFISPSFLLSGIIILCSILLLNTVISKLKNKREQIMICSISISLTAIIICTFIFGVTAYIKGQKKYYDVYVEGLSEEYDIVLCEYLHLKSLEGMLCVKIKDTSKNLSFQQKSCPEIGSYLKNSSKMVNEYAFRAV